METFHATGEGWEKRPQKQRILNNCFRSKCSLVIVAIAALALAIFVAVFLLRDELRPFIGGHRLESPQAYLLDPNWDFTATSTRRDYTWVIEDVERNPDGVYRPMMVINGQFPGPLIEANEGDTIVVQIINKATNATSIHWHGLYQNGSNWMDGTVGITQCPIAPGANFTYEFRVNGQSGTYWYHGHHSVQSSDGLVGPLIIHSKDEKALQNIEYESDRVVMVQDHYYDLSGALIMDYLKPDRENAEPVPAGALINGQNIRNCADLPNRKCDNSTARLAEFNLEPGKNHRLRFINVGALATFQVQLDEHEFAITEVDGTDVLPQYYHRLKIQPAQRYSIVVNTNVTTGEAYWLRARMVTHCFAKENIEMAAEVWGIVRYTSSSPLLVNVRPSSRDWPETIELDCSDMDTSGLRPAIAIPAPTMADDVLYLRVNFEIGAWKLSRGFFNASSWRAPVSSPTLNRLLDGYTTSNESFTSSLSSLFGYNSAAFATPRELVYQTTGIRTIDILMQNFNEGSHPMHLHGYKFWVLAQGHGYPPKDLFSTLDLTNPLRRDTVAIEAFGWTLLRFTADNAGIWAFHCHLSWHAEAGLLMQFLTKADEVAKWSLPTENLGLCELEGHERGKGPDDEIWYGHPS
ncbi:uncharacterized protein BDZ99DRAFT_379150 [Mytilinidion resinicola]|uniref:Multicopper oxidase n=1 Tax=Mytilinidion resinicola TaxID=574789 RepID=A0A6A6Z216_9PEZI|nr:uncharacterized protein BDZ99DRAFT_379150 [Mytilinidion resinicola]KAF2815212.1 hypothetical protein BDZ99DRAFT_379150 [Mytilinidion resinicola]